MDNLEKRLPQPIYGLMGTENNNKYHKVNIAVTEETNHVLEYEKLSTDENDESKEFSVPDFYFSTNTITIAHCPFFV